VGINYLAKYLSQKPPYTTPNTERTMKSSRSAVKCPKCDVRMKRIYVKVDNRFKGLGSGCLRCGQILFANDEATERTPFDRAWEYLLKAEAKKEE